MGRPLYCGNLKEKKNKKLPEKEQTLFNNHYMGITERFLWEHEKWEVWKMRRVVCFQSLCNNEPTSCWSMLGFHTVMKSRFLSSTKDVAHHFGMTLFFLGLRFRFLSLSVCVSPRMSSLSVSGLLDYELMSGESDGMTCSCFICHLCNR